MSIWKVWRKSDYLNKTSDIFILPQVQFWNQNEIMRRENFMESGGYSVAIHFLAVWKHLVRLAPDQPHGWSFPDVEPLGRTYGFENTNSATGCFFGGLDANGRENCWEASPRTTKRGEECIAEVDQVPHHSIHEGLCKRGKMCRREGRRKGSQFKYKTEMCRHECAGFCSSLFDWRTSDLALSPISYPNNLFFGNNIKVFPLEYALKLYIWFEYSAINSLRS